MNESCVDRSSLGPRGISQHDWVQGHRRHIRSVIKSDEDWGGCEDLKAKIMARYEKSVYNPIRTQHVTPASKKGKGGPILRFAWSSCLNMLAPELISPYEPWVNAKKRYGIMLWRSRSVACYEMQKGSHNGSPEHSWCQSQEKMIGGCSLTTVILIPA